MKNPWKIYEKSMKNPWKIHEKSMKNPWKIHEKSMKNPWKIHEKSMKNPWKIHEKSMKNPWNAYLKIASLANSWWECSTRFNSSWIFMNYHELLDYVMNFATNWCWLPKKTHRFIVLLTFACDPGSSMASGSCRKASLEQRKTWHDMAWHDQQNLYGKY